jgi:flagellar assembly factor FliW
MSFAEATASAVSHAEGDPIVLTFLAGLVGLPTLVRFDLRPIPETELFELVSLDDTGMGFVAARAEDVRPGMVEDLRTRELVDSSEDLLVLLAVHGEPPTVTANLAGPLAVDLESAQGRQLVIEDAAYGLREPIVTVA